jgi:hypothetical protein
MELSKKVSLRMVPLNRNQSILKLCFDISLLLYLIVKIIRLILKMLQSYLFRNVDCFVVEQNKRAKRIRHFFKSLMKAMYKFGSQNTEQNKKLNHVQSWIQS